jgi:sulfatase modifying factor 1
MRLAGTFLVGTACACGQLTGLSNLYLVADDASATPSDTVDAGGDIAISSANDAAPPLQSEDAGASEDSATVPSDPIDAGRHDAAPAGSPDAGSDAGADTGPPPPPACIATGGPALVNVGAFCVDATEVTNDQYSAFLASSPATSLAPAPACTYKTSFAPSTAIPSGKGSYPVVYVDWCDAYAFCAWAGKHLCGAIGGGSSSKANAANKLVDEWYVACSMDGANVYPYCGNAYVQGKCNDSEAKVNGSRPVGSFTGCVGGYPGVSDMNGNAYEWEDACDVSAGASDSCVIRGGAWDFSGTAYGGCNTYFNDYTVERSDTFNDTGFRCCDR